MSLEPVPAPDPIDTSHLRGNDWCFVVGYLVSRIERYGMATREDAFEAIASALEVEAE